MSEAARAHARMERSEHFGKIVLDVHRAEERRHGRRTPPFQELNQELIDSVAVSPSLLAEHDARMLAEGGHRYHLLPLHFVFPQRDCAQLGGAAAGRAGIPAKVLPPLPDRSARDGVLRRSGVPRAMQGSANGGELLEPETLVSRF